MFKTALLPWVVLAVPAGLVACRAGAGGAATVEPSPLIADLESYRTPSEVQSSLRNNSLRWEVTEETKGAPSLPRYDFLVLRVRSYEHLGHRGELRLYFFNDRLMQTLFLPADAQSYTRRIRSEIPTLDAEISLKPYTRVFLARDEHGRSYVSWEDVRLARENDDWIRKHS